MAQKVHIVLEDDLDGSPATETVSFGLDGKTYEIDLNDKNAGKLRDALAQYVGAGRSAGGVAAAAARRSSATNLGPECPRGPRLGPFQRLQRARPRPHPGRRTDGVRRRQLTTQPGRPGAPRRRVGACLRVRSQRTALALRAGTRTLSVGL